MPAYVRPVNSIEVTGAFSAEEAVAPTTPTAPHLLEATVVDEMVAAEGEAETALLGDTA